MPAKRWLNGGGRRHARGSRGAVNTLPGALRPPHSAPQPVAFGTVIYDLEAIHDAERGVYVGKGLFECEHSEQIVWKRRSQVIQFAAVDLRTGERICASCRPKFEWDDVKSLAARRFAEDHGHDLIVKDMSLPHFEDRWKDEIMPFLKRAAGQSGRLAMIAHNGDNFDHYVLSKELRGLKLSPSFQLCLHCFDPVRTLKALHGEDYGTGGQLRLETLHTMHVPADRAKVRAGQHQALDDCLMLREVLAHWQHLAGALASEISSALDTDAGEVAGLLGYPREPGASSEKPAAADASSTSAGSRASSPRRTARWADAEDGEEHPVPTGPPTRTSLRSIGTAVRPFVARSLAAGETSVGTAGFVPRAQRAAPNHFGDVLARMPVAPDPSVQFQ